MLSKRISQSTERFLGFLSRWFFIGFQLVIVLLLVHLWFNFVFIIFSWFLLRISFFDPTHSKGEPKFKEEVQDKEAIRMLNKYNEAVRDNNFKSRQKFSKLAFMTIAIALILIYPSQIIV